MKFIDYNVFKKASALVIQSRFSMFRMLTSPSVFASAAFGLLLFLSLFSCLLRASKVFRVCTNSRSSITIIGYLQAFKGRLKLEKRPLRLKGLNSSPSFLLKNIINSTKKSFSCLGRIFSRFLFWFSSFINAIKMAMSCSVFLKTNLQACLTQ